MAVNTCMKKIVFIMIIRIKYDQGHLPSLMSYCCCCSVSSKPCSCGSLKASRPLVGFGVLIDNTIKGLTCLHEIMSRNLIKELVLNKRAHELQASLFIPLE